MTNYEPNTEPYNETGAKWVCDPPTTPGWYWYREPGDVTLPAQLRTSGFWLTYTDLENPEQLALNGGQWWSERIKEPHP